MFLSLISDKIFPSLISDESIPFVIILFLIETEYDPSLFSNEIIPSLIAFFFKKFDQIWSHFCDGKFKFSDGWKKYPSLKISDSIFSYGIS